MVESTNAELMDTNDPLYYRIMAIRRPDIANRIEISHSDVAEELS